MEDLYVSSMKSKERYDARSYARLKEQRNDVKDSSTLEEWDCPRPGEKKKNDKIVKNNIKRMEKKMQEERRKGVEYDSLSGSVAPKFDNNNP